MANFIRQFVAPGDTYNATYTSDVLYSRQNETSNSEKALVQVQINATASVDVQYRLNSECSWVTFGTYTANTIVEVPLAPEFRVVATITTGVAKVWISEIQ